MYVLRGFLPRQTLAETTSFPALRLVVRCHGRLPLQNLKSPLFEELV